MAISFPLSPNSGDEFTSGSRTWIWNGSVWVLNSDTFSTPFIPELDDINDVVITPLTYAIGDTGPAGGKIFITPSTVGNSTGKYFEVVPVGEMVTRAIKIDSPYEDITGADGTAIGTGQQNTLDLIAWGITDSGTTAAAYADALTFGGFSDWFLPSTGELAQLYTNRSSIGFGAFVDVIWSSSDILDGDWYTSALSFFDGTAGGYDRDYAGNSVAPVRSFTVGIGAATGEVLGWDGSNWVNTSTGATTSKIYVQTLIPIFDELNETVNDSPTWTCPAGVTQVKVTLIGGGGAGGFASISASAAYSNASTSNGYVAPADGGNTTMYDSDMNMVFSAQGGSVGFDDQRASDYFVIAGAWGTMGFASVSVSAGSMGSYSNDYGSGGASSYAEGFGDVMFDDGGDNVIAMLNRVYAKSGRGIDGSRVVSQQTVVPGTTYTFEIGLGGGYDPAVNYPTEPGQGKFGAAIIEYVL